MSTLPLATLDTLPAASPPVPAEGGWKFVIERFRRFHTNVLLTPRQRDDALMKATGVVRCLNAHYYDQVSGNANAGLIGSWGKNTQTRPPRDVDLYFKLPLEVQERFQGRLGNRQSGLLQEVKNVLLDMYPRTDMRGDGQVVVVAFESYSVEVVPAFELKSGRYLICDTKDGGSYKETNPIAEAQHVEAVDAANAGNLRPLIRMLKAWQASCNVPIKSFHLELMAATFLAQSPWRLKGWLYYDWLLRDFFEYMQRQHVTFIPGSAELVFFDRDAWLTRAEAAHRRAVEACENERANWGALAGIEWQKIFGTDVPVLLEG
jgi:hypothetical protein